VHRVSAHHPHRSDAMMKINISRQRHAATARHLRLGRQPLLLEAELAHCQRIDALQPVDDNLSVRDCLAVHKHTVPMCSYYI